MILSSEQITNFHLHGYHITEANNLKLIKEEGILPKCGSRSKAIGDTQEAVYFFPALLLIDTWREALYSEEDYANLELLRFDLENIDITITDKNSWDLFGDWYTKQVILPEKIQLLKRIDKEGRPFSLDTLLQQDRNHLIWEPICPSEKTRVLSKTIFHKNK